jgi:hypothetical protein
VALNLEQQQQQLNKLNAELANLKKDQARLDQQIKGGLLRKPDLKSAAGLQLRQQLADATNLVNSKQKEYDDLKKVLDAAKADTKVVSEVGSAEEARKAALAGYGPNQIAEYRADVARQLADKKAKEQAQNNVQQGEIQSQELANELATAGQFIATGLDDQGRVDLAAQLNAVYGINLPLNGKYSPNLKAAYTRMLTDRFTRSLDEGRTIPVGEFLAIGTKEGTYRTGTGTGAIPTVNISDPTEAAGYVRTVFKSVLQRDPTSAEISKYSKILQAAEKRSPKKTVNGVTTGGLGNPLEFLTVELQKLPEFAKKKTDKTALTSQSILGTARANGVTLNQAQLDSFTNRVQDGTDIKAINSEIRGIAGLGMPEKVQKLLSEGVDLDTIYSPYKNVMASILELNPESIDLKDPTLRSAFGPDKETSIYDFEKTLRKDYRWQYTDNAKRDVSNVALKVLRDFGFQA